MKFIYFLKFIKQIFTLRLLKVSDWLKKAPKPSPFFNEMQHEVSCFNAVTMMVDKLPPFFVFKENHTDLDQPW